MKGNKTHENKIVVYVNERASRSRFKGIFNFLYDDESKKQSERKRLVRRSKTVVYVNERASRSRFKGIFNFLYDDEYQEELGAK